MNSILRRRRAAMAVTEENHLIYSLYNQSVSRGNFINTGVSPWKTGKAMTILYDFNETYNWQSGNSATLRWIYMKNDAANKTGVSIGKKSAGATSICCWYMGVENALNDTTTSTGRHRFTVTHEADSDTIIIKYKKDDGTVYTYTLTQSFVASPTSVILFGASENSAYSLPPGTLTKAEIYDVVLDSAAIDAFFA